MTGRDVNTIAFGAPLSPYSIKSRPPENLMLVTDASSLKKRSSAGCFGPAQAILVATISPTWILKPVGSPLAGAVNVLHGPLPTSLLGST